MTWKVAASQMDRHDSAEDGFQFGDPIPCHYHWLEPGKVDEYGDDVRHLSMKVELAVDAFERTSTLPEESFAGEAADMLRTRADNRRSEAVDVRDNLRGLGRAINSYSGVLRQHRRGLEDLQSQATSSGLEVRDNRIWPPVETIPGDSEQKVIDAWNAAWKAYTACYDAKIKLRDERRAGTRLLVQALAEFAGVHPDPDQERKVGKHHKKVEFGELRREAAEEAREAVEAASAASTAAGIVEVLKKREQAALDELEALLKTEAPAEEIRAQSEKVAALHAEVRGAQEDAVVAANTAEQEQREANQAARLLNAAEKGAAEKGAGVPSARPMTQADLQSRLG